MAKNIHDCIMNASDFGISGGKTRFERLAHLLFHRPDIHWDKTRPSPDIRSPDHAAQPAISYSDEEIGLRDVDGDIRFIGLERSDDIDHLETLSDGISELAERLFSGSEIREHMYFTPGTVFGKIPREIPVEDLVFMMSYFRYVHRTLDRVVFPDSVHPGVPFDVDEFETVLLVFLTHKLKEAGRDFDTVSDNVVGAWV